MNRPAARRSRPRSGANAPSLLGLDALLDFRMEVTLDGETLTADEIKRASRRDRRAGAASAASGSRSIRERLQRMIDAVPGGRAAARASEGLSFAEAMRLLAGRRTSAATRRGAGRRRLGAGRGRAVARRDPGGAAPARRARPRVDPGRELHGTLRPYQQVGVRWLHLLARLGSAPASPTTWASARPSRCCRCCWC